ncbi:MAG: hypothetical protein GY846_00465 [Deltaproteobacteria bacterium]|nr:hypothetical protein [Deltaproteobacteria bacterium]
MSIRGISEDAGIWFRGMLTIYSEENEKMEERHRIIKKNQKLWGNLKEWLLEQSHNKCWHTEALNDSSHYEVEHFRPKKWRNNSFEGYWWLAFDWTNYRVCGNAPNRKKGSFFPLHPDSRRATSDKQHLLDDELFGLLDPIDPADPLLLSYDDDATCIPTPGCGGWEKKRADMSIERYGLNSLQHLREGRQKIWAKCRSIVDELAMLHSKNQKTPTADSRAKIKEKTMQLRSKLKAAEPFSAVARECLKVSGYPWAQRLASTGG